MSGDFDKSDEEDMRKLSSMMAALSSPSQDGRDHRATARQKSVRKTKVKMPMKSREELEKIYSSTSDLEFKSLLEKARTKSSKLPTNTRFKTCPPKRHQAEVDNCVKEKRRKKTYIDAIHGKQSYSPYSWMSSSSSELPEDAGASILIPSPKKGLFSDISFYWAGNKHDEAFGLLLRGGAKSCKTWYGVTHFLKGPEACTFQIKNAETWQNVTFVGPDWVHDCVKQNQLVPVKTEVAEIQAESVLTDGAKSSLVVNEVPIVRRSVEAPEDSSQQVRRKFFLHRSNEVGLLSSDTQRRGVSPKAISKSSDRCRRERLVTLEEVLPMSSSRESARPGEIGLVNFGNTCFMNSGLQCLLNTPPLMKLFLEKRIRTTLHEFKDSLVDSLLNIFSSYWNPNNDEPPVREFVKSIRSIHKDFDNNRQHDCQEFLLDLFNALDEKIKKAFESKPGSVSQIIPKCFQFMIQYEVACSKCKNLKKDYDYFYSVPLSFPPVPTDGGSNYSSEVSYNIYGLLRHFIKSEILDEENLWNCYCCGSKQSAAKSQSFFSLPNFLIIHLKRFAFVDGISRKLRNQVSFPVTESNLDMKEFIHKDCPSRNSEFNLYGCVCHTGDVSSGHYTSFVKNAQTAEWHFFNDDVVTPAKPDESVFSSAYLLFYTRKITGCKSNSI